MDAKPHALPFASYKDKRPFGIKGVDRVPGKTKSWRLKSQLRHDYCASNVSTPLIPNFRVCLFH